MSASNNASREELLQFLSTLSTAEILSSLGDTTIAELAALHGSTMHANGSAEGNLVGSMSPEESESGTTVSPQATSPQATSQGTPDRAKRPLNAFMAFRSYYLKLFPDIQQKTASGFLTTLWNRDPCRNRWALIAKVYSFVRDSLGKTKVPLSSFLALSCPIMRVIHPDVYLSSLGWSVRQSRDGQKLIQDEGISNRMAHLQDDGCPSTDVELLDILINVGYIPEEGFRLLERLKNNTRGLMTTTGRMTETPAQDISLKTEFANTVRSNTLQAAKELLGEAYDEEIVQVHGVRVHTTADMSSISHLSMQPVYPNPAQFYNFSSTICLPTEETFDMSLNDYECVDLDNPFDLDFVLGHTEQEGERTAGLPPSPPYNHEDDFQFMF